jgi:uncharacterized membrane protein YccC
VKRMWTILAGVFAFAALVLFLRHDYDKAFVCAALGAVGWFLGYRIQIKAMVRANEPPEDSEESLDSNEET